MFPRISLVVAVALLLAVGCASPTPTGRIGAVPPEASTPATVAAAPTRAAPLEVVPAPAGGDDGDALPPIPVPEGWVPVADPSSRDVLGLDALDFGADAEDGPEAGPGEGTAEAAVADTGSGGTAVEGPAEDAAPDEEVSVEVVRYEETVEVDTEVIEIGTPVLVIEGYSSWAYGPFRAVRSAPCFDPCFTPPRGACWQPVAYDPCWNPCCDPAFGSWQAFDRACNEPLQGAGRGRVGLVVVDNGGDRAPPRGPRVPPARKPIHGAGLGAAPVAIAPATGGAGTGGATIGARPAASRPGRNDLHGSVVGARSPGDTAAIGAPGPLPQGRAHRLVPGTPRAADPPAPAPSPAMAGASSSPAAAHGAGASGRASVVARIHATPAATPAPAARAEGPATTVEESAPVPVRTARHERPAPAPKDGGQDEARATAPAPPPTPAARGGRSRDQTPAAPPPERTRPAPAPASPPAESPRGHGGGGHERAPDRSTPPPPPPPPPPPASSGGHHR